MHICPKSLGDHGCAECLRNRVYDKRVWCHRMDLEARCHANNSFLTLTYSDENLPKPGHKFYPTEVPGSLVQAHVVNFNKSLLQALKSEGLSGYRYFFVGEYGDQTERPHYHAALFGVGPEYEDVVRRVWKKGHVMMAELNIASIRYITGYVTKKMNAPGDDRLNGRWPEFRLMSKGLGRNYVPSIVSALDCEQGEQLLTDDVPTSLRLHGRNMPLGRYMRDKIRKEVYKDDLPQQLAELLGSASLYRSARSLTKSDKAMQAMYENYVNSSMSQKMTFLEFLRSKRGQKYRNIEAQFKLNHKGEL